MWCSHWLVYSCYQICFRHYFRIFNGIQIVVTSRSMACVAIKIILWYPKNRFTIMINDCIIVLDLAITCYCTTLPPGTTTSPPSMMKTSLATSKTNNSKAEFHGGCHGYDDVTCVDERPSHTDSNTKAVTDETSWSSGPVIKLVNLQLNT